MHKIRYITTPAICSIFLLMFMHLTYATTAGSLPNDSECSALANEIIVLEKDLLLKNQLLSHHKELIDKLPPEASANKMKLTSEVFIIAAEREAAQNWLEVKRKKKATECTKSHKK